MLGRGAEAAAEHAADHHRRRRLAAEHVAELGRLVEDLVEADPHEVDEHQLGDRPQARGGRTHRGADEARFADRRVEHPGRSELRMQAFGDAERAAPGILLARRAGAAGDVLAHQDDPGIAGHLLGQRLVDRLSKGKLSRHRLAPLNRICRRRSAGPPASDKKPPWPWQPTAR